MLWNLTYITEMLNTTETTEEFNNITVEMSTLTTILLPIVKDLEMLLSTPKNSLEIINSVRQRILVCTSPKEESKPYNMLTLIS